MVGKGILGGTVRLSAKSTVRDWGRGFSRVQGKADVNHGRALVELFALMNNGGDRIAFKLDAEPDRDKFILVGHLASPGDGLMPALIGTRRPINLDVGGNGGWTRWRGQNYENGLISKGCKGFRVCTHRFRNQYNHRSHPWSCA